MTQKTKISKKEQRKMRKSKRPVGYSLLRNVIVWAFIFLVIFVLVELSFDIFDWGEDFYRRNSNRRYDYNAFDKNQLVDYLFKQNPIAKFRWTFLWVLIISIPSLVALVLFSSLMNKNKRDV